MTLTTHDEARDSAETTTFYQNLRHFRFPGVAWVALLVFATAMLQALFAQDAVYYQIGLVILSAVAKALDINFDHVIRTLQDLQVDTQAQATISTTEGEARGTETIVVPQRVASYPETTVTLPELSASVEVADEREPLSGSITRFFLG